MLSNKINYLNRIILSHRTQAAMKDLSNTALTEFHGYLGIYDPEKMAKALEDYDYDLAEEAVLGVIHTKEDDKGINRVAEVMATKGYGPILYLLHMQDDYLAPHLNEVTPGASQVWKKFFSDSSVDKIELDDDRKEPWLNYKYKSNRKINTSQARSLHNGIISDDPYGEKKTILNEALDAVLTHSMRGIYSSF